MTDKRLKWLNALLLVTAVYLGAKSGYNLISSRLDDLYIPSALVQSEPTSAIKPDRPLSYYRPIIDRNLMNTTPPETTIPDRTTTDKMRKTDLKLKLLGTVAVSGDIVNWEWDFDGLGSSDEPNWSASSLVSASTASSTIASRAAALSSMLNGSP